MNRLAIIGFGCAGFHGLSAIRSVDPDVPIDVYSETGDAPYNPMLTTYYVAGKLSYEAIFPFGSLEEIEKEYRVNIIPKKVSAVDCATRTVYTGEGPGTVYDKILISTGAGAFVPPSFAPLIDDLFCMRTVNDALKLHRALDERAVSSATVIGASMVGIKVAELLYNRGIHVTLADMGDTIFALAAYPEVARMIEGRLVDRGMDFKLGSAITGADKLPNGQFELHYADGSASTSDLLILNIGVKASLSMLDASQLQIDRGIIVDEHMETSAKGVYAAGDCCQAMNLQSGLTQVIGLWANAGLQGRAAGLSMAGGSAEFKGSILHNITHFMDLDFIGIGDNRLTGKELIFSSPENDMYIQAILRDGKPVGFNILNNCLISGILKAYFTKLLLTGAKGFSPLQKGTLEGLGVSRAFINELEGWL